MMKAYIVEKWCEPEDMIYTDIPEPTISQDEILIQVKAAGINFPDLLIIQGKYQARPKRPFSPGSEVSGIVLSVGSNVTKFKVGDRVAAVIFIGGYAEQVAAKESFTFHMPESMSFEEAAGFHITYQSSYFGIVRRAALKPHETLLVHAGAGGIGTSSIQIGKAIGSKVYATAGTEEKLKITQNCGADLSLNYNDPLWSKKIRKEYGGADVVIDPVGGEVLEKSILCTNFEGRIVVVGFTSGKIAQVATNLLLLNNIGILGLFWNLYIQNHPQSVQEAVTQLNKWYTNGILSPIIYKTYALEEAPTALRDVTSRKSYGKAILKLS